MTPEYTISLSEPARRKLLDYLYFERFVLDGKISTKARRINLMKEKHDDDNLIKKIFDDLDILCYVRDDYDDLINTLEGIK